MAKDPVPDIQSLAALARDLSALERGDPTVLERVEQMRREAVAATRPVVFAGPPGVGKSTLLRAITRTLRQQGETVAIIASDPRSARTGGAFLGDRVRFSDLGEDRGCFFRSVPDSRGAQLCSPLVDGMCRLAGAAGFRHCFVETVGTGQLADPRSGQQGTESEGGGEPGSEPALVLVLAPSGGDEMQMLKAGLLEEADLWVVTQVDRPGGEQWARRLADVLQENVLQEDLAPDGRVFPVVATASLGLAELVRAIRELHSD